MKCFTTSKFPKSESTRQRKTRFSTRNAQRHRIVILGALVLALGVQGLHAQVDLQWEYHDWLFVRSLHWQRYAFDYRHRCLCRSRPIPVGPCQDVQFALRRWKRVWRPMDA